MPSIRHQVQQAVRRVSGSSFWRVYTITSSNVTVAAQNLTVGSTGRLAIKQIILQTDSTGLAGGTNFELRTTNAKGVAKFMVETVANLGANVTKVLMAGNPAGDTTTADAGPTVTAAITALETGAKIQHSMSVGAGTGAGTVDIYIQFERIDDNADIV